MSDVDALRQFAQFQAATVIGSATNISDVTETHMEAAIDRHIKRLKQHFLQHRIIVVQRGSSAPAGSSEIEISELARDEAPLSDFEVLDDLRTPKGQIRRQISALRAGGRWSYGERLARRLEFLLEAPEEEGEEWGAHSPESLRQMFLFLQEVPDFRYPTVTVTPSATFRAQWQGGKNEHFAVDFLPDGQVRFVVFAPDPRHPHRVQRVSGVVSRADVLKAIEPYKVHRWAADART